MATRHVGRGFLVALMVIPGLAILPTAVRADEAADRIQALEESVRALQQEVTALKEARPSGEEAPAAARGVDGSPLHRPAFEAHMQLHNLLIFRNDTDFDRRKPLYNENGQTSGAFATVFGPTLTWNLTDDIRVFYEAEVGLNYWSKNNPDQENALGADIFVLKHRQIYAEGALADGRFGFKVGYQYATDSTALFLGHWIGAAQIWWAPKKDCRWSLRAGMIPDLTYEGLSIVENNFRHDIFTFGIGWDRQWNDHWSWKFAVDSLYDTHVVGRPRWLVVPNLHLEGRTGWMRDGAVRVSGFVDAVVQGGRSENSALDGGDQTLLAWAAQGNLKVETRPVTLALNALALSPDDDWQGNNREGSFFYSSKSQSATLYFTEDEVRNWYDQLDRRMGRYEGGFWQHRAGLFVADLKATLTVLPWFRPSVILGYGIVLNPHNALGERQVGFEGNLDLAFQWTRHLVARVLVGGMAPGKAAAALMNQIAPQDKVTDGLWWTEAALSLVF